MNDQKSLTGTFGGKVTLTDLGNTISGIVKLVDETGAGAGARDPVVHAIWERPDGSTFDQYANIGTRLTDNMDATASSSVSILVLAQVRAIQSFMPSGSDPMVSRSINMPTSVPV